MTDRSTRETRGSDEPTADLPDGFREIAVEDTPGLFDLFDRHDKRSWCCYAPFLTCYHTPPGRRVLIGERGGATVLLSRTDRKRTVYNLVVPPVPFDADVLINVAGELTNLTGMTPRVQWCDALDADLARDANYLSQEKEREYIYDPGRIASLEGSDYKELRKRIRRAEKRYRPDFRPMTQEDVADAHAMLEDWRRLQGKKHDFLLDWGYTRAALDRFGDWSVQDLSAWCVRSDGALSAFAMAGRMASDQACFFVAKSDPRQPGLSDCLRHRVYEALSDYRFVNDAGDLGLPGLRQHKRRFRPVRLVPVYTLHRE